MVEFLRDDDTDNKQSAHGARCVHRIAMTPQQILNRAYTMVRNLRNSEPVKSGLLIAGELPLCTMKLMRDKPDSFGGTLHYAVQYQDNEGNYQFGWVPVHIWDSILKPMTRE